MHFEKGVVVEAFIAQIQHEMRPARCQIGHQSRVIIEIAEPVLRKLGERCLEPRHGLGVLFVEAAVALDRIGQPGIAENDGDFRKRHGTARQPLNAARCLGGQEQPVLDHAEILVARRIRRRDRMEAEIAEAGALHQRFHALLRIEALGIELVGDDAALGVHHHLAADQPVAVFGEAALAAHEMVLIDPLPGARLEMRSHPLAVHQIHDQDAARGEGALDRFEHRQIVLRPVEIAERVAEDADAVKFAIAKPEAARVAFMEGDLQISLPGTLAGEADQIARAVEPGDALKAAARQFEGMPALAATQIEQAIVALKPGAADQEVDFLLGVAVVLDNIAIGFEIERIEQRTPPLRGQVPFEIGYRP